jgi:2-amino-4-hydroxy-6-hydroxymethyldihydropteridine diphosphokinase
LNESEKDNTHQACLLLGSNIRPDYYFPLAIQRLKRIVTIEAISDAWETEPIGSNGPKFINASLLVCTKLQINPLKLRGLRRIETLLGRRRSSNKYAPRRIDIDIIVFDDEIVDENLWKYPHIAIPCSQVLPQIVNETTGESLEKLAIRLEITNKLEKCPEILANIRF